MTKLSTFFTLLLACFFAPGAVPAQVTAKWAKPLLNPGTLSEAWPITVDPMGNIYEAGMIAGEVIWGHDTLINAFDTVHIIVVSADSTGHQRWMISINSSNLEMFNMVADQCGNNYFYGVYYYGTVHSGSLVVSNSSLTSGMYVLLKFDSSGHVDWIRNVGHIGNDPFTAYTGPCGLSIDQEGNPYVAGIFDGATDTIGGTAVVHNSGPSPDTCDVFVAKFNPAGDVVWARSFGGRSSDFVNSIAATPQGEVYVGGVYFSDSLIFGGDTLFNPTAGTVQYPFIAKYDALGNQKWIRGSIGNNQDRVNSLTTDRWGNVYMAGGYLDSMSFGSVIMPTTPTVWYPDYFLIKFDSLGNALWGRHEDTFMIDEYAGCVAADNNGHVWIVTIGDAYLVEYDTAGTQLNIAHPGMGGGDDQDCIALDNNGNVYIGDDFESPVIFGADTLTPIYGTSTYEALVIAKYSYPFTRAPLATLAPLTLCRGEDKQLTSAFSCTYWTSSNPAVATVIDTSGLLVGISAGSAVITYQLGNTGFEVQTVTVITAPAPITGPTTVCLDSTLTLSDSSAGGLWTSSNTALASIGSVSGIGHLTDTGKVVIKYSLTDGCIATDTLTIHKCRGVGISSINAGRVQFYPNPVSKTLTITADQPITKVAILNLLGQTVFARNYDDREVQVDVSYLTAGVYFVKINGIEEWKFVKQ